MSTHSTGTHDAAVAQRPLLMRTHTYALSCGRTLRNDPHPPRTFCPQAKKDAVLARKIADANAARKKLRELQVEPAVPRTSQRIRSCRCSDVGMF